MGESINGETASSKTLSHLTSYPVVSDSISTFKSNPYGAKSLEIADNGYSTFVAPTIPYLSKPYSFVSPYVAKADSIGDGALSKIDETFPVVKTETSQIKDTAFSYANYPFDKFSESKKYAFDLYGNEYKKCGGDGVFAAGKAVITSSLIFTSDTLTWLSNIVGQKKAEAKEVIKEKSNN